MTRKEWNLLIKSGIGGAGYGIALGIALCFTGPAVLMTIGLVSIFGGGLVLGLGLAGIGIGIKRLYERCTQPSDTPVIKPQAGWPEAQVISHNKSLNKVRASSNVPPPPKSPPRATKPWPLINMLQRETPYQPPSPSVEKSLPTTTKGVKVT